MTWCRIGPLTITAISRCGQYGMQTPDIIETDSDEPERALPIMRRHLSESAVCEVAVLSDEDLGCTVTDSRAGVGSSTVWAGIAFQVTLTDGEALFGRQLRLA